MGLEEKYRDLTSLATDLGITDLQVREQNSVLYIDGTAKSAADKNKLWEVYGRIDPDFRAADAVVNIAVTEGVSREYTVENGDSLSKIAKAYGISWQDIFEANKDIISNPDLIQPGWKLKIPTL
ncbi:LysM peptidoglycan-binding domain-containing protein [Flavobacterium hydrophilum]|uniref:Peptidoglycan-binding protein n=1 Tax=Flavobacterium hydrophilum TaxID=2211445 RepID=A0A2V4C4S8_9FLAO|nr:LysM peptidoglycan-binding domain-containing protein [Flavobacterium hydrophilum]PXY46328.1 peptidoglycan-binding protein [Flavobacterium hydrophilum]